MLRGDSAFGTKKVIATCLEEGVEFSLSVTRNKRITTAIQGIDEDAYTPVHYPGRGRRPRHRGADLRRRGRRNPLHPAAGPRPHAHHPAGGAPGQRRPLPRRVVSGVALSPVCDQLRPAHRRGRHHPPPPRHHRDHLRRPDRRAAGAYPVGAVRRQLRLAGLRGDRPQPVARRRRPSPAAITPSPAAPPCAATWSTCRPASPPRPANPCCTCPPTGPGKSNGRPCGTTSSATRPHNPAPPDPTDQSLSTPPSQARPEEPQGKAGTGQQITHAPPRPRPATPHRNPPTTTRNHPSTDSG